MSEQEVLQQMEAMRALNEPTSAFPYFEFVYDEHWDLGYGWSGDF